MKRPTYLWEMSYTDSTSRRQVPLGRRRFRSGAEACKAAWKLAPAWAGEVYAELVAEDATTGRRDGK